MIIGALRQRLQHLHDILAASLPAAALLHQQSPLHLGAGDPVKVLIIAILSQATSDHNCLLAYNSLRQTYPSWEALALADEAQLAATIRAGGLANSKAARIKQVLAALKAERGEYALDWLGELERAEAYAWLTTLPGVGLKTAACVWAFGFNKPALPVDTHVFRVLNRLKIFNQSQPEKLQVELETHTPPAIQRDLHVLLIHFGRTVCRPRNPLCEKCPLSGECPFFFAKSS